jgi:hypothetical protein
MRSLKDNYKEGPIAQQRNSASSHRQSNTEQLEVTDTERIAGTENSEFQIV